MSEMIKCGWRACQQQIEAITDSGAQRQYCSDRHKVKASAARTRKARAGTTAFRHMRVKQASGFAFAKMMEAAERVAAMHGYDPGCHQGRNGWCHQQADRNLPGQGGRMTAAANDARKAARKQADTTRKAAQAQARKTA
jgi:hypothetical protein